MKTKQAPSDPTMWESDFFVAGADSFELLGDASAHGGILRIRQLGTVADAVNHNARLYPRDVLQRAVEAARPRAAAGVMLSERVHPEVVATRRGEEAYIDNPERKTARVDSIEDVAADGSVHIIRTILNTPEGRKLAASYRSGSPPGLSTRFKMRGHSKDLKDGRSIQIADEIHIHTFDDVDNPAVPQTRHRYELLTDSLRAELGLASASPIQSRAEGKGILQMNETIKRALASLNTKIAKRATAGEVLKARTLIADQIEAAGLAGEDVTEATANLAKVDAIMRMAGYDPGRPAPVGLTFNNANGFAPDMEQNGAIEAAIDAQAHLISHFTDGQRQFVTENVRRKAANAADVEPLMTAERDAMQKLLADASLISQGAAKIGSGAAGRTTHDPASPGSVQLMREAGPKWQQDVDKILAAADQTARLNPHSHRMGLSERKKLREYNRKHFIDPLIEDIRAKQAQSKSPEGFAAAIDSAMGGMDKDAIDKALSDSIGQVKASYDSTSLSNMYNQPSIAMAILIQSFQDLEMLQFVEGIGPVAPTSNRGGWDINWRHNGQIGSVLRVPVELYVQPGAGSYGQFVGNNYDAGFMVPEGIGIPEIQVVTNWLPYAPVWRRIAAAATRDVIKAMGNGPLNYDVIGRHLYHMTYAKNRAIDKAIGDEMLQTSDEYGAVAVTSESPNLTYNSAYASGGSVTVNLNPTKAANATVATGDAFATYGANVKGAIRLQAGAAGTSSPYFGNGFCATPIVQPRIVKDLTQQGQYATTTQNPFTLSAPASGVQGYLDATGQVQTLPGGGSTATFAVDYQNAVVVFASGVSGGSGVVSTTVTASYTYATNYDLFSVLNPTIPSGQTVAMYRDGLLELHDQIGATMGSAPRYVKPDMALMSLNASVYLSTASLFYKFNSPDGTSLFPTENYFYQRTGIRGARHNTPWFGGDRRILFGLEGATKYAIDSPFEARGPYPKYDSTGSIVATDLYYAEENSVVCTPQVTDQSGNVINPVYRSVVLY